MLDVLGTDLEDEHRNILKGFYGMFKAADDHLCFVFLTGVTKFSQVSVFSDLNQPDDISMNSDYDAICGITEEEVYSYFKEAIEDMADDYQCSIEDMKIMLKKRYDGYHFSKKMLDIYNPFSLINTFRNKQLNDYWFRSGTPTYLIKLLAGHHVNIQKLIQRSYKPHYFIDYRADKEDPLAMLYQSRYLTIKGYDIKKNTYTLDYPNVEVQNGFVTLLASHYFEMSESDTDYWIEDLNSMFESCDLNGIRDAFTSFLASIPYDADKEVKAKDYESHYSYTFYLINKMLGSYNTFAEKTNSMGKADVVVETESDIFIFEFKINKNADIALAQIDKNQYALPYLTDKRKLHKIGVNISSKTRTIDDWKVID